MDESTPNVETGLQAGFLRLRQMKARREFVAAAKGARSHRPNLSLQVLKRGDDSPDAGIGFTVTKKEGNSVERNRIRRRLREAARRILPGFGSPGADHVLIGRRAALDSPFPTLLQDLKEALAEAARRAAKGPRPPKTRPTHGTSAPDA